MLEIRKFGLGLGHGHGHGKTEMARTSDISTDGSN